MLQVTTTDSSTPCCKKTADAALPPHGQQRRAAAAWVLALGASALLMAQGTHAQEATSLPPLQEGSAEPSPESASVDKSLDWENLRLQRDGESLLLSARFQWSLPDLVLDALLKGIPVHFIAEAQMLRERWYWSDQQLLSAVRYMRLSYQPLIRRWRLYDGSQPFEGQGLKLALSSTFESLADAVQAMQRIVRWRIGSMSELPSDGTALLQLRFRIDLSHFPRPLQIGALGRSDWNLLVTRRETVDLEALQ